MRHIGKRKVVGLCALGFLLSLIGFGLDSRPVVQKYTVRNHKLTGSVRLVFLSDLHSCDYGEDQRELLDLVEAQAPDIVLLGGDWVDDDFGRQPPERAYSAAESLAEQYPTFYVSGNHEIWSGCADQIKTELARRGVRVLAGERVTVECQGQSLDICGIDDPDVGEETWAAQLAAVKAEGEDERFRLLLTHRPERLEDYAGFDLALAGHAHGGQWRFPGLLNGLFAPDQGLFPQYAGGSYGLEGGGSLIVGRGLARESTRVPRFWNRPEVVTVDLLPAV